MLSEAGIKTDFGLLSAEAEALNPRFLQADAHRLPAGDGQARRQPRRSHRHGERREPVDHLPGGAPDVQRLRARHDAVLSSAETVLADGASLNVRWDELPASVKAVYSKETLRQPLRVIVDSQNRLTRTCPCSRARSPVLLARHKVDGDWPAWVQQLTLPLLDGKLDLVSLFMLLAKQNINSVLVEAGPRLCGALLAKGLVDEAGALSGAQAVGG